MPQKQFEYVLWISINLLYLKFLQKKNKNTNPYENAIAERVKMEY